MRGNSVIKPLGGLTRTAVDAKLLVWISAKSGRLNSLFIELLTRSG